MREDSPIIDTEAWERVGRGKGLQFFATDEEMQGWVADCPPERYRPYYLVGSDLVREGGSYVQRPFRYPSDELILCLREGPEGHGSQLKGRAGLSRLGGGWEDGV